MSLSERDKILIQKALEDKLNPAEAELLEVRKGDEDFMHELSLQTEMRNIVFTSGRNQVKSIIQSFEDKYQEEKPTKIRKMRTRLAQTAILLLLLGIGLWWFVKPQGTNLLFTAYYSPYANVVDPITKGKDADYSPYQLYELGRYDEALLSIDNLAASEERFFYEGLTLMQLGSYASAELALQKALDLAGDLQPNIEWYLLMNQMALNNIPRSIASAERIVEETSHPYYQEAQEILQRLKELSN